MDIWAKAREIKGGKWGKEIRKHTVQLRLI